jgi:hypothetical protein
MIPPEVNMSDATHENDTSATVDAAPRKSLFHFAEVFGIATLLAYGVLRLAYAMFYDRFGVGPEEVGVGGSDVLAQAGAAFFLLLFLPLVAFTIIILGQVVWWMGALRARARRIVEIVRAAKDRQVRRSLLIYLAHRAGFGAAIVSAAYISNRTHGNAKWLVTIIPGTLIGLLWGAGEDVRSPRDFVPNEEEKYPELTVIRIAKLGWRYRIPALIVTLAVPLVTFVLVANSNAILVQRGQAITWPLTLPIGPHGAEPVVLTWLGTPVPNDVSVSSNHCLMLLGAASGTTVVYDVDDRRTMRLPSDSLVITRGPKLPAACT